MRDDLLDVETGNLFGRFSTEEEALAFVRALIDANGAAAVESLALGAGTTRDVCCRRTPA